MGPWMVVRQLVSIAILPFTVTVLVPVWIARANRIAFLAPRGAVEYALCAAGLAVLGIGLALFGSSLFLFWTRGRGTLAPWDPPRVFVAEGPYRHARNPMISGVVLVLLAESMILRSWPHAEWAGAFLLINLVYIPLVEEPMLSARFGESYAAYRGNVPRFLPRLRPWRPGNGGGSRGR
ncbi:MAG: isoprenylcysteine carboxylmethyltransferase family protein [Acidobacteria bacterium]|nr:MAG: isoprenylcysteine carboxylmethyltransferase family protein [Acidobacteriota bacterium]